MSNWKEIADAPGYFVSRFGDVYSAKSGRELKPTPCRDGYLYFTAQREGRQVYPRVHREVAAAFIGPCPDGLEVRHLNGNPADNRVENIRYGTGVENAADRDAHGTTARGIATNRTTLTEADVIAIRNDPRVQQVIADEYGISQANVSEIKRRKTWRHVP